MRAGAYARYSSDRQDPNSIDAQLSAITRYCQENGHTIVATFVDMAQTGTNTERPDFQRMIQAAKDGAFDCIIIYDMTRGSRDIVDWFTFRKLMHSLNINVFSATETLGSIDNPDDFLKEAITATLGQHMVLQTRKKSIAGVAEKAKKGVFLGGSPPLGYDVKEGQYIINAYEAEAVKLIFSLYAMGESYSTIIDQLAAKAYVGKYGRPLGKNSLNCILQNERYIGTYFWNTRQVRYMRKWAGGKANPDAVRIEGAIPAIIDNDTWERVQTRMKHNKRNAANGAKYKYLLSGMIECAECGGAYTGRTSTSGKGYTTRSYVCGQKYRTRNCKAKNINADELETAVVAQLRQYFAGGDFDTMADEIFQAYQESKGAKEERQELAQVERKIANGTKAILDGADFSELREELARLKVRKAELEEILAMSPNLILTRDMIATKLKADAQSLQDGDIERLIKAYVTKIYAHSDEIIITGGVNMSGTSIHKGLTQTLAHQQFTAMRSVYKRKNCPEWYSALSAKRYIHENTCYFFAP